MQVKAHAPGTLHFTVWWVGFLSGGGRLVLGLVAGGLAVSIAKRLVGHGEGIDK
jgi:hypothetical protein